MPDKIDLTTEGEDLLEDASNYNEDKYVKAANTVDICICRFFNNELQILLIKRKHNPFKDMYAIPGGYVDIEKNETLEQSALRELKEETSIMGIPVYQLRTYGDPDRDPRDRTITTVYFALVRNSLLNEQKIKAQDDAKECTWFSLNKLPGKLAFDHKIILIDLFKYLKERIIYTDDAFKLAEKIFTMADLQKIYEFILQKNIAEFSNKINQIYNIELIKPDKEKINNDQRTMTYQFLGFKNII
jgi:8-oxo-dGTP diphosphatase